MTRDAVKLLLALLLGAILTLTSFWALNHWFDAELRQALMRSEGGTSATWWPQDDAAAKALAGQSLGALADQFLMLMGSAAAEEYASQDPSNLPEVEDRAALLSRLADLVVYGAARRRGPADASLGFGLPILANDAVKPTLGQLDKALWSHCATLAKAAVLPGEVIDRCTEGRFGSDSRTGYRQLWSQYGVPPLGELLEEAQGEEPYRFRRYLNGSIQGLTLWLSWTALVFMGLVWVPGVRAELAALRRPGSFGQSSDHVYQNGDASSLPGPDMEVTPNRDCQSYREWLATLRRATGGHIGSVDVLYQTVDAFLKSRTVDSAARAAESRFRELQDEIESRLEAVRYLAWAVPSIGFVGTVLGIGAAMLDADGIITAGGDRGAQASAIQLVTGHLGTAFDTTLVALLCSLVLMLAYHACMRYGQVRLGGVQGLVWGRLLGNLSGITLEVVFQSLVSEALLQMDEERLAAELQVLEKRRRRARRATEGLRTTEELPQPKELRQTVPPQASAAASSGELSGEA